MQSFFLRDLLKPPPLPAPETEVSSLNVTNIFQNVPEIIFQSQLQHVHILRQSYFEKSLGQGEGG